jgi:anaerobic magnesium-protoporphyrin IX monomethyl ester cyclase
MILLMTTAPPEKSPWGLAHRQPPLGLAFVAAAVEKAGFPVKMLDNYLMKKPIGELKEFLKELSPEIVAITCSSNTYNRCIETAKAIKEVLPSCIVVAGGWHPTCMPESVLKYPEIDYAVMGEGELGMVELAKHITKGAPDSDLASIPSIAYKKDGKVIQNKQKFIEDMDQIPYPARHLLPMDLYDRTIPYLDVTPVDTMAAVRGCPHNCNWCNSKGIWGQKCRGFSAARIVDEMNYIMDKYGTKGVYFLSDNFTFNKKNTMEMCRLIKERKLDIQWVCETGVDMVSRELLKEMKSAGCKTIFFGVESGSPQVLEKINRGIKVEQITNAFKLCKEAGLQTVGSAILGIPGETIKDMETTFKFLKKLDPDWHQFHIFIAYPGCSLYDEILQSGLYDRMEDFLLYVKTDEFDYASLLKIHRKFHGSFNKSPKRILRKIRKEGIISVSKKALNAL